MSWQSGDYAHPDWRATLERNGWDRFESVWNLPHRWVEPVNRRRGGWGAVARHELQGPDGARRVYLKVHCNQRSRSLRHALRGRAVLAREFESLRRCRVLGIGCPQPVYFADRLVDGETRSLLATAELKGFRPLAACLEEWAARPPGRRRRDAVVAATADLLRRLHAAHFKVNSFTTDHVFLREGAAGVESCLVDLERLKPNLVPRRRRVHDLATLRRSASGVPPTDRVRFLCAYLGVNHFDAEVQALWRAVEARCASRVRARQRPPSRRRLP